MKEIWNRFRNWLQKGGKIWKGLPGKKKAAAVGTGSLLVLASAAIVLGSRRAAAEGEAPQAWRNQKGLTGGMETKGDFWYVSGLTGVGLLEDVWELDFLETPLVVEETYLHVGDAVKAGEPVFKVAQETLEAGRKQLEKEQKRTQLAVRQGLLDYETGKAEAKCEYDKALIAGKYAQADYENALAQAQGQVDSLQKQKEEAQELVDTYTASMEEDYYYTYYKVGELKQLYEGNFTYLMQLYGDWEIAELEGSAGAVSGYTGIPSSLSGGSSVNSSAGGAGGSQAAGGFSGMAEAQAGRQVSDEASRLAVYQLFDQEVTKEANEYQEAKEKYEEASAKAAAGAEEAKSQLKILQAQLTQAQTDYETQKLTAQAEADQKKADSDRAEAVYEAALEQLEEAYEKVKEEAEEARGKLELFEQTIGDGYFYAGGDGTVIRNELTQGMELTERMTAAAYSDPQTVTVTVSVGQENIAQVKIGDEVTAAIDGFGIYEGKVTSFDPVTQSQSKSRAEYVVTVTLDGTDRQELEANLTAYVYFGLTQEQKEQMERQMSTVGGSVDE